MAKIEIKIGDITEVDVDAIVNAANTTLSGGGGVDGAIHRAAGPQLLEECRKLAGCPTGQAKITKGYKLKARHVIHTVGPVWQDGSSKEDALLSSCYHDCLRLAVEHGLKTIAFPAISCGAYRFPPERAARIALKTVKGFLPYNPTIEKVIFVCFDREMRELYDRLRNE